MQMAREVLKKHPDLRTSVQQINLVQGGGFRQTPFNLVIRGPDLGHLDRYSQTLVKRLSEIPGFVDVDTAQALRHPEVQVHIDRKKASDLKVSIDSIASSLRTMVGGERVTTYREADEQYDVRLRLMEDYRKDASVISQLTVPSSNGGLVKLNNVTNFESGISPAQIDRYAQERQITVISNLYEKPLGQAIDEANAALKEMNLLPEYRTVYIGRGKLLAETAQNFLIAFVLSLAFIYMVLAAQFESFVHPLAIMMSLPLSLPFGLIALMATGKSLNVYSAIGVMLLFGVVKKNAILQVDYTNVLRAQGMPRYEAMVAADRARLRPILMTTLSIIAGMLPIALGRGDGSASRASMATIIVGGQALCLLITLLITPVVYSYLDDLRGAGAFFRKMVPVFSIWVKEKLASGYGRLNGFIKGS